MKSARFILAMVSAVGLLAMAATIALSQTPGVGASSPPEFQPVAYPLAQKVVRVRAVLNQFDYALATHDVEMLQATGVKQESAKRWQRFFRNNPHATVTDQCSVSDLFISGDTAVWTCTETATVISEGKPRPFVHTIRFTFARDNGMWMVADRR